MVKCSTCQINHLACLDCLFEILQKKFNEMSTTKYEHQIFLHLHVFLERCSQLKTSLHVIVCLQLFEKNNDSYKVFILFIFIVVDFILLFLFFVNKDG